MDFKSKPQKDREHWGIIGTVITIVGVLISIMFFLWQEAAAKGHATWVVKNEEKLVEVRETVKDLRILYQGKDILESDEEFRILTLDFVNDGKHIRQEDYDRELDFGLCFPCSNVVTCRVVDCQLDGAPSMYLSNKICPVIKNVKVPEGFGYTNTEAKSVIFPQAVFDRGSLVRIKVYLLQEKRRQATTIIPLGKITGIKSIPVLYVQPAAMSGEVLWVSILLVVVSVLLGVITYAYGLRVRTRALRLKTIESQENLRQELQKAIPS